MLNNPVPRPEVAYILAKAKGRRNGDSKYCDKRQVDGSRYFLYKIDIDNRMSSLCAESELARDDKIVDRDFCNS